MSAKDGNGKVRKDQTDHYGRVKGDGPANYLKAITKDEEEKVVTIFDQNEDETSFPYGGEPSSYLKNVVKDTTNEKIIITKQDDSEVEFPYGGASDVIVEVESEEDIPSSYEDKKLYNVKEDINIYTDATSNKKYVRTAFTEASNGAYINTGVIGNTITKLKYKFKVLSYYTTENSNSILGCIGGVTGYLFNNVQRALGQITFAFGNSHQRMINNDPLNKEIDVLLENNHIKVVYPDGTIYEYEEGSTPSLNDKALYLYCLNNGGNKVQISNTAFYFCEIYGADGIVRNYVPVKEIDGDGIGLFDIVNNKFYGNSGEVGTFVAGSELPTIEQGLYFSRNGQPIKIAEGE